MFLNTNIQGDPNIGMYGFATDSYAILGMKVKNQAQMKKTLRVPINTISVLNSTLAGLFITGNSTGIIVPKIVAHLTPQLEKKVRQMLVVESSYTAFGNLIVLNDAGILISSFLRKHKKEIEQFFGIPVEVATIAGGRIIGNLAVATNKGCLVHPKIKPTEQQTLERVLGVPVMGGTVNYGSFYPRVGLIANSNGFVASKTTSGHEMGRIQEALGLVGT